MSKGYWVQNGIQYELLEFDDFCPDAIPSFPPSVRIETGVVLGLDCNQCRMAFHGSIEHSP
jgi:hypothetical protein